MTEERTDFIAKYLGRKTKPFIWAMKNINADWLEFLYIEKPTIEECDLWQNENEFRLKSMVYPCIDVTPDNGGFEMLGKFYPYNHQKRNCENCGQQYPAHYEYEWLCGNCYGNWRRLMNIVSEVYNRERFKKMATGQPIIRPYQLILF